MSPAFSQQTRQAAYEPFTPNNSGQRSRPTYYRGCWHVVSRRFFDAYPQPRQTEPCPAPKGVYNPKASIPHAASLHQACAHCAISPTAASRRSLGRISVPVWPTTLSGRLPVDALVGRHPTNKLIGREPIPRRKTSFPAQPCDQTGTSGIRPRFQSLSRSRGAGCPRITHPFATNPHRQKDSASSFDLHVLSTPPAFVLSQDQTLHKKQNNCRQPKTGPPKPDPQKGRTRRRTPKKTRRHNRHPHALSSNQPPHPHPAHTPTQAHAQGRNTTTAPTQPSPAADNNTTPPPPTPTTPTHVTPTTHRRLYFKGVGFEQANFLCSR